ncbi:MAG TPA: PAS domain S-box protein [Methanomicrobiales archaeon]|nr:PAS domain S-box protein [Methanomicrobiales archaeon]
MESVKDLEDFGVIKRLLRDEPRGMTVTELARALGRTKNTVGRYLDILHASGQVEMRSFGMAKVFTLTQRVPLPQLFSHTAEMVMILDRDRRVLQVNDPFLSLLSLGRDDVVGKNLAYLPVPEPGVQDMVRALLASLEKESTDAGLEISRGGERYLRAKVIPILFEDGSQGSTVILADETPVRLAEKALRESEKKYRELVEKANTIILKMDLAGGVTFFNEYAEGFFGFSRAEILGKNVIGTIVPPTESSGRDLEQMIARLLSHTEEYESNENENITKEGRRVWVRWSNQAIRDEQGNPVGVLSVGSDITEHRRLDEELRRERDFIGATLHILDALVVVLERDGRIMWFNHACEALTGYAEEEVKGRPFWEIFLLPEERDRVREGFDGLVAGQGQLRLSNFWVTRTGERKYIRWSNTVLRDEKGSTTHVIGTGIDITEHRRLEEELGKYRTGETLPGG